MVCRCRLSCGSTRRLDSPSSTRLRCKPCTPLQRQDNGALYNTLARVACDPQNHGDDHACYDHLQSLVGGGTVGPVAQAGRMWKQVKQLRCQKAELLRETCSILGQLGRLGSGHAGSLIGYVSIGDNGKMVHELRRSCGLTGEVWVVHDADPDARGEPEVAAVLERGSVTPAGRFVAVDYTSLEEGWLSAIPSGAADLVTMNQGLHHLPPSLLRSFLREVRRVLRPNGLFIVRVSARRRATLLSSAPPPPPLE